MLPRAVVNNSAHGLVPPIPIKVARPAHQSARSTPYIVEHNLPPGAVGMTRLRVPRDW